MSKVMTLFFLASLVLGTIYAEAEEGANASCSYYHIGMQAVHYSRQFFEPNTCYVDVTPMETSNLVYRSYLFSEQGLFMIFNSYGDGEPSKKTGARVLYLLPRGRNPHATEDGDDLQILLPAAETSLIIDGTTARLKGLMRGSQAAEVTESPEVTPTNHGGVEIKNYPGLVIDAGFALGKDPASDSKSTSLILDQNGKTCRLANRDLFKYESGNYSLKRDDLQFKKYLKEVCPELEAGY